MKSALVTGLFLFALAAPSRAQVPADLAIYGRVWTGDPTHPWAEVVAVRGDRIVGVGARRQALQWIGRTTRVIDNGRGDRKSTRLNSSHIQKSRMPSSA